MSATYSVSRNSNRWPLTLFFSLLNSAAINAFVIFNQNTDSKLQRRFFIKDLALSLVKQHQMNRLQIQIQDTTLAEAAAVPAKRQTF